mmetsp:Transcript_29498/g.62606  ORF Transcript_29498/g.62606 Transcript_29498/m.62606 type:complete len:89 (-) Transcript_29498:296-562(-)|eukprot:CAMPEP_0172314552 /NCGR_PEP_ID=MMETSP1058-20130122/22825_1 /TAXON_ID=83371 /ORGANISM="Detonula confervacea, Strain CCMP 353" /LENGTH=88 /DNA_ID=CAMNT_0013028447 /DNA_START=28 /DNA_END=294 /DNA_ORIENTATION=-
MRTTSIVTLFLSTAQAFSPAGVSTRSCGLTHTESTAMFSSPLDGMNREMLNDDDDVPMTRAEMKAAEKEMKAEMKRLKEEAAAAAKEE